MRRCGCLAVVLVFMLSGCSRSPSPLAVRAAELVAGADPLQVQLRETSFLQPGQGVDFTAQALDDLSEILTGQKHHKPKEEPLGGEDGEEWETLAIDIPGETYCSIELRRGGAQYPGQTIAWIRVAEEVGVLLYDAPTFTLVQTLLEGHIHIPDPKMTVTGGTVVQLPREARDKLAESEAAGCRLLLEQEERVLLWCDDRLWWVNFFGEVESTIPMAVIGPFGAEQIRASALTDKALTTGDYRVLTPEMAFYSTAAGEQTYPIPEDVICGQSGHAELCYDMDSARTRLAFVNDDGCWLAAVDGTNRQLIFSAAELPRVMLGGKYQTDDHTLAYLAPRLLDGGRTLTAEIHDLDEGRFVGISIMRLDTGNTLHLTDLYIQEGQARPTYLEDRIFLWSRRDVISTASLIAQDLELPEEPITGYTYDNSVWLQSLWPMPLGEVKIIAHREDAAATTLMEASDAQLMGNVQGMTKRFSLWGLQPLQQGEALQIILLKFDEKEI